LGKGVAESIGKSRTGTRYQEESDVEAKKGGACGDGVAR